MVRRELRASGRRLGLHMLSISLGVAALVAINSFRANVTASVREQSRALLGSDLAIRNSREFPDSVQAILDSARQAGVPISYLTSFASMALVPRTGATRLVQVRAMDGDFPYYGEVATVPAGRWKTHRDGRYVLADPTILYQLDVQVGDTLRLGDLDFEIAAAVTNYPGRVSLQAAIGPRVYIPLRYLPETNLIRRGSRAFYWVNLQIPDPDVLQRFLYRHEKTFERHQMPYDTVDETEDDLTSALDILARFLGLVGLAALLLGGVGVASAVHVFVKGRLDSAAILRCLGANDKTVFLSYLVQAGIMGAAGAAVGVALGVAVQFTLPSILGQFLPLDVRPSVYLPALGIGFGVGVTIAMLFALLPLLALRGVPPLRALRREFVSVRRRVDPWRLAAGATLVGGVVGLAMWQAPEPAIGLGFAGAIGGTAFALWITALILMWATRRFFPTRARYEFRQGIANLFRPRNQTVAVTLALGFGSFLVATLYVVQRGVIDTFSIEARPDRPNLVMFDIQPEQRDGVLALLDARGLRTLQTTPIVPARIARLNGRTVEEVLDTPGAYQYERWALRREYRHTYRDTIVGSERIVEGAWWSGPRAPDQPARISMEQDVAQSLNLGVGDRVTWNVQGLEVETEVISIRTVDWARFEPNFYVVFEPGVLEGAPQMSVILTRAEDPRERALFQRDLIQAFPNVAALDLTTFQRTIETVVDRVTLAIRFMAFFSIASGLVILIGALTTSKLQRLRESLLLRTLGATARRVRTVLATEYFALGALGGLTGVLLAVAAGWASLHFLFELPFSVPWIPLLVFWLGTALLTTAVGLAAGRDVVKRAPLEVMREMSE